MIPTLGKVTPRPYQWYDIHEPVIAHVREQIKGYMKDGTQPEAAVVSAFVGAGKTINIGAIANHCSQKNLKCLVLARQGELIRQNSDECWNMDAPTSLYSASLNSKAVHPNIPVVAATEGTIVNALDTDFAEWLPLVILIDECMHPDTLISTEFGDVPISSPKLKNLRIWCFNEDTGAKVLHKPKRVFTNGTKDVSCVKFIGGELKCTSTHKIYSEGLWVEAQNLSGGQKILLQDLQSNAVKRLLRASVAVARKLILLLGNKTAD